VKKSILTALKTGTAPMVLGLALTSAPAFAQDKPAADETAASDENVIVVTGSLIQNPNIVSTSPVSAIGSDEIALRQVTMAEDIVRQIPGAVPSIGSNVNNGNGGASYVNLRGLGSNRNIVLLDGARIVPADRVGRVDLNNIPVALIQRVDALTGGASTTYGADAVSGVVNFVTKKNFAGVQLDVGYGKNQIHGDGESYHADLTIGGNFDDGRGNAVLSVGYQRTDPVYQGDRDISVFGISSSSGRASGSSFTAVPTTISFPTADLQVNSSGSALVPQYQGFNFNPYNIFVTPVKRYNIYASANYEVSDAVEVYTRGMFSRNSVGTIIAPSGIFGEALTIPANNPYLNATIRDQICTADGIALGAACNTNTALPLPAVYRRSVEVGPRISTFTTQFFDYRFGVRGNISSSFKYDLYGAYGESENTEVKSGYVSKTRVQEALNATSTTACLSGNAACVPLNLFGPLGSITAAQAAYIGGITSSIVRRASLGQIHGVVSGELPNFTGSSNPIAVAVGAEYRKYTAGNEPDNLAQVPGELGGAGGATLPVHGGYDVKELFGELNVPIASDKPMLQDLSVEAGVRGSWYTVDTAGKPKFNTTTWKTGLNWSPVSALKLRANYQRAVRAPNIGELFDPVVVGLTNLLVDPCAGAAPTTNANLAAVCIAQGAPAATIGSIQNPSAGQANSYGGGNPNIKPEVSDSWSLGFVLTPDELVPNLSITFDYYNMIVNKAITTPTPGDVISACFGSITASSASSPACLAIFRSAANGRLSGSSATVKGLPGLLTNSGRLATDGVDFTVDWKKDLGFAKLAMSLNGNWTNHSRFQASPTSVNRDCVGYYSANCGSIQPKWSWTDRTTLSYKMVDLSVLWRHISSVRYEPGLPALFSGTVTNAAGASSPLAGTTVDMNKISAYDYFDLSARVSLFDHYTITGTITNLFNRKPPLVGSAAGSTSFNSGNTYPSTYDAVGRRYMISGSVKF